MKPVNWMIKKSIVLVPLLNEKKKRILLMLTAGILVFSSCSPDAMMPEIPNLDECDWGLRPLEFTNTRLDTVVSAALVQGGFEVIHTQTTDLSLVEYPILGSDEFRDRLQSIHHKVELSEDDISLLSKFYTSGTPEFTATQEVFHGPPTVKSQLAGFYLGGATRNHVEVLQITESIMNGTFRVYPDNWEELPQAYSSQASAIGTAYASNRFYGGISIHIWNYSTKGFGKAKELHAGVIAYNEFLQGNRVTSNSIDNANAEIGGWLIGINDIVEIQQLTPIDILNVTEIEEEWRNLVAIVVGNGEVSPASTFIIADGAVERPSTTPSSAILDVGRLLYSGNTITTADRFISEYEANALNEREFTNSSGQEFQAGIDKWDDSTLQVMSKKIADIPVVASGSGNLYYQKLLKGN